MLITEEEKVITIMNKKFVNFHKSSKDLDNTNHDLKNLNTNICKQIFKMELEYKAKYLTLTLKEKFVKHHLRRNIIYMH